MIVRPSFGARPDAALAAGIELANVALGVTAPVFLKLTVDALTKGSAPFGLVMLFIAGFVNIWAAFHLYMGSRTLREDLAGANKRRPASSS